MTTIAIPISDKHAEQLRLRAEQQGLTSEEFLRLQIERLLDQPEDPFRQAAAHVLKKNAELYRRLA